MPIAIEKFDWLWKAEDFQACSQWEKSLQNKLMEANNRGYANWMILENSCRNFVCIKFIAIYIRMVLNCEGYFELNDFVVSDMTWNFDWIYRWSKN